MLVKDALTLMKSNAISTILKEFGVKCIASGSPAVIRSEAAQCIARHALENTLYVVDLGRVHRQHRAWTEAMPRVTPFYAMKCNPERGILRVLDALGSGFDCASRGEMETVLDMGVDPGRIVFAHPCKRLSDIRYAKERGISRTTFDSLGEIRKIATANPAFECILRIRADDPEARVPLGLKYGAEVVEAPALLAEAKALGVKVIGVSFHVGSACKNPVAFTRAIEAARTTFDVARTLGHHDMCVLDIGGGFSGSSDPASVEAFGEVATRINESIERWFPESSHRDVEIISEPGRYFAETSSTVFVPVYGTRDRLDDDGAIKGKDYWLTDGLYGSFNCILYDGQRPKFELLRKGAERGEEEEEEAQRYPSTLWGPTCDSADFLYKDVSMPALRVGDWLQFPDAGAYTIAGACDFNGIEFTSPNKMYVWGGAPHDLPTLNHQF